MCEVEGVELYWTGIGKIMTVKTFKNFFKNFTNIHTPTTDRRNLVYVLSIFGFASTNYTFGEEKFLFTYTHTISKPQTASSSPKHKKVFKVCMYITRVYNEP